MTGATPAPSRSRVEAIDLLRGLVMVLMALDHVRDYVGPTPALPEDLDSPGLGWFLTRWITHFCAPVFVFLAGTSAWLWASRGRTRGELARFLVTRGLWLIFLELTVVFMVWTFAPPVQPWVFLQVIWVIGVSMIALAGLIWLPRPAILVVALAVIAAHNLMDGLAIETHIRGLAHTEFTWADRLYTLLHLGPVFFAVGSKLVLVIYPIVPWFAVLALGYVFGAIMGAPQEERSRRCIQLGLGATVAFLLLRSLGGYGDPQAFVAGSGTEGVISFLNTQKYPPSLQFLLMTLGPALLLLGWIDRRGVPSRAGWLVTLGRVPLFFYVLHVAAANLAGALYFKAFHGMDRWQWAILTPPEDFDASLGAVYVAWLLVVAAMIPLCRWFAKARSRGTGWWWSYL